MCLYIDLRHNTHILPPTTLSHSHTYRNPYWRHSKTSNSISIYLSNIFMNLFFRMDTCVQKLPQQHHCSTWISSFLKLEVSIYHKANHKLLQIRLIVYSVLKQAEKSEVIFGKKLKRGVSQSSLATTTITIMQTKICQLDLNKQHNAWNGTREQQVFESFCVSLSFIFRLESNRLSELVVLREVRIYLKGTYYGIDTLI